MSYSEPSPVTHKMQKKEKAHLSPRCAFSYAELIVLRSVYYSMSRISEKPVTSKISIMSSLTLRITMWPCLFMIF